MGFVEEPSDRDLARGLRQGEGAAFDGAYERYHAKIFNFLYRLAGRRDLAEDLFQETWLRLAQHGATLHEDTDLCAWLFTVARNLFRSHRRWAVLHLAHVRQLEPRGFTESPEARTAARHQVHALERALERLTPDHREVLILVGLEELEAPRVAGILGITADAVRQRLSRARAGLAVELAKEEQLPRRKGAHP